MIMRSDSNESFGEIHFGSAQLGDARRTKRLVACADAMCRHPGGTLPDKFQSPADLKAFYRLCSCPMSSSVRSRCASSTARWVTSGQLQSR